MSLSNYHAMIMMPLGDRVGDSNEDYLYDSLCNSDEGKECRFSSLRFGYDFIIAYSWLKYKMESKSADMELLYSHLAEEDLGTLSYMLKKRYLQDAVICKDTPYPCVIGSNIVTPGKINVNMKCLLRAFFMLVEPKKDPLLVFLNSVCKTHQGQIGSINSIVHTSKSDRKKNNCSNMATLIKLIDFPIPSIYVLLKALGFNYFTYNPYLDAENSFGKNQALIGGLPDTNAMLKDMVRFYYTDPTASEPFSLYKFIPKDKLIAMILDGSAFEPLQAIVAQDLGIITNHIIYE